MVAMRHVSSIAKTFLTTDSFCKLRGSDGKMSGPQGHVDWWYSASQFKFKQEAQTPSEGLWMYLGAESGCDCRALQHLAPSALKNTVH
jgi:hypothetical protein